MTTDGGKTWNHSLGPLALREHIEAAAFSADGSTRLLVGHKGSALMTTDRGQTWETLDLPLKHTETILTATLIEGSNAKNRVFVVLEWHAFMTRDEGQTWTPSSFPIRRYEEVSSVAFSADGQIWLVGAPDKSLVWMTRDGGQQWTRSSVPLQPGESVNAAAFSVDGKLGVVAGFNGSIWLSTDGGWSWRLTKGLDQSVPSVVNVSHVSGSFFAATRDLDYYRLKTYPELKRWREWSIEGLLLEMKDVKTLRESQVFKDISRFVDRSSDSSDSGDKEGKGSFSGLLNKLTIMRVVTMTILFFLVQILVRLYQYSLRLSSFWESRADAVFLARSFAEKQAERFDDLVYALGPDAYDFKPQPNPQAQPQSMFDWRWPRSKS